MDDKIKFGMISLTVIIFQSILKLYGVLVTGSLSFLSETIDTLTDIVFVAITLYALSHSQKPADLDHMYGHEKIDSIGAMVQGIVLINLYLFLIINAIGVLLAGDYTVNNPEIGLQILIISFFVNIVFSRILISQGKKKKSLSLEIQGLNLFQDSLRAIIVIVSFIFVLYQIIFLDIIFSIALSGFIIFGAFKLAKKGVNELTDTNPIDTLILEELRTRIFDLEHVNAVNELKIRAHGGLLFLEVRLSVEDHISVIHAHEITKSIRTMGTYYFPSYTVECVIEMNPLGGETSLGESIINLIISMKTEFPEIINVKDINIFSIKDELTLSAIVVVDEKLTLQEAHRRSTYFEKELQKQAPNLSRVITHIEAQQPTTQIPSQAICETIDAESRKGIQKTVEEILRGYDFVKGYHGFEFWAAGNYCILELHVFFDGSLNISKVHEFITVLEQRIKVKLRIDNLQAIILHSEPIEGKKDGVIFN